VAAEGLPQLGPAVLPELRQALDLNGTSSDARCLAAVCRISRPAGAEVCRLALQAGSNPRRRPEARGWRAKSGVPGLVEAMRWVPEVLGPAEAEQLGLAFAGDGDYLLRGAALAALRGARSKAALECLLAAVNLDDGRKSLLTLPNPATTGRLLEELAAAVAALERPAPPLPKPRGKTAGTPDPYEPVFTRIWYLAWTLGLRQDGQRAEVAGVLVALSRHRDARVRQAALHALMEMGPANEEVVPRVVEILEEPFDPPNPSPELFSALWVLDKTSTARREPAGPVLLRLVRLPALNEQFHRDINRMLACPGSSHLDEIRAVLVAGLLQKRGHDSMGIAYWALRSLGELGPAARPDIPAILEYFSRQEWDSFFAEEQVLRVLPRIDPEGTARFPG
jgi:hypothetical protein